MIAASRDPAPADGRARTLYEALLAAHGPQGWWPGDSPFEIAAGAILVQRTAWRNADAALAALARAGLLAPESLAAAPPARLERLIRPAGFFRQKARTLGSFCEWLVDAGGFGALASRATPELRSALLSLRGIGPETADCILLYALDRPLFVVDAYARRIFARVGLEPEAERLGYGALAARIAAQLPPSSDLLNEFHALLVAHGKSLCRREPGCARCPLARQCDYARGRCAS